MTTKESQRLLRSKKRAIAKTLSVAQDKQDVISKVNKKRKIDEITDLKPDERSAKKLKVEMGKASESSQKLVKPVMDQVKKPKGD